MDSWVSSSYEPGYSMYDWKRVESLQLFLTPFVLK